MIREKRKLTGNLNVKQSLSGSLGNSVIYVEPITQEKEVIPTKEIQEITPDTGYTGLSKVKVNGYTVKTAEKTIVENGTYDASKENLDGYSKIKVAINNSIFSGSYDRVGLKQIGWEDEEIDYYNENGVQWYAEENDYFKLTTEELAGDNSTNTRFLPKNSYKKNFKDYSRLIAIPNLDISGITTIPNLFSGCRCLTAIPNLDTSNVTDMSYAFFGCYSLKTIPQLNTSKVRNMTQTFRYCSSLSTIPNLNTSNVTNMSDMFDSCASLKTIPLLDTGKVTNFNEMFSNCYSLKSLPLLDTNNATSMSYLFKNCFSLTNIPHFNTSNVTNMSSMFSGCSALVDIPLLNTSNVTNMNSMFNACSSLKTIPNLNTSKAENFGGMFASCRNLKYLPLLDFSRAIYVQGTFSSNDSLTTVEGFSNLGKSYLTSQSANNYQYKLELQTSPKLTEQSIINILNNLYDIKTKGCKVQIVTLGATNLAKLTSEDGQAALSNAQSKGWTIS